MNNLAFSLYKIVYNIIIVSEDYIMISNEQVEANRLTFLNTVASLDIPGADLQGLVDFLDGSDFFDAPASTQYHCAYRGGLCQHSLNVFNNIKSLAEKYDTEHKYDLTSLAVVSLFHDISKTNFYEPFVVNKKIYNDKGTKSDNMGRFDWFAENTYKIKEAKDRYLASTHGTNSFLILSRYIPLTDEEMVAIINHHAGMDDKTTNFDLTPIFNKYPLATLLHMADFLACYIDERI